MSKSVKILVVVVLILVALAAGSTAYYFYAKYQDLKKNPERVAQDETNALVEKVGKLMQLPSGETPTIATVQDKTKLQNQPFFKNAENGDKVLVYMNAKKAILYRPSTNKIIEVAPLSLENNQQSNNQQATKARVVLLNGTNTTGLTNNAETKIKDVANILVAGKDNAQNKNYTKTIVVDLNGNFKNQAEQIAAALGGEVGSLPSG